jgi:hypothetical protein
MLAQAGHVDGNLAGREHLHGVVVPAHHSEENNR